MILFFGNYEPSLQQISAILKTSCPEYELSFPFQDLILVKKNHLTGVIIIIKKRYIKINGNFPGIFQALIFAVVTVLTGVIIPVALHLIFLRPNMVKAEKKIAAAFMTGLRSGPEYPESGD